MMQESGQPSLITEAETRLESLLHIDPENEKALFTLGMLATDRKDFPAARQRFEAALKVFREGR